MKTSMAMRAVAVLICGSLAAFGWSVPAVAQHGGGGGGGHGGGGYGGHGGRGGFGGRGGYGGYRGGYGGHGGYGGYRGGYGYGGFGWGGVGLGLGLGLGLYYASLPFGYLTYWGADGIPYYYADNNYYQWDDNANEYETVSPPPEVQQQSAFRPPTVIAYPKSGQTAAQQATDETQCRAWAVTESGFDPTRSASAQGAAASGPSDFIRAQTACLEGRDYSVK